jgi:hypothetical protein
MGDVQVVDGGSPRHRSCMGSSEQHHSGREGYEGERPKTRVGYLIAEGERTSTLVTHFVGKGSHNVDAPACVMCHHLLGKGKERVIGDGNVV